MGSRSVEAITALAAGQQDVLAAIAGEKAGLKPYLDAWEKLEPGERERLRKGRAGEILDALEAVAKGIQARHQDWFGEDAAAGESKPAPQAGGTPGTGGTTADGGARASGSAADPGGDIAQKINMYRGLT